MLTCAAEIGAAKSASRGCKRILGKHKGKAGIATLAARLEFPGLMAQKAGSMGGEKA